MCTSASQLLPSGRPCFSFGYCRQATKTVNHFDLHVLLGLLALLNCTATSTAVVWGLPGNYNSCRQTFCTRKVYGPFLLTPLTLLTRKPQLGAVFQHQLQSTWRQQHPFSLACNIQERVRRLQQSRCTGSLFLFFLFH